MCTHQYEASKHIKILRYAYQLAYSEALCQQAIYQYTDPILAEYFIEITAAAVVCPR